MVVDINPWLAKHENGASPIMCHGVIDRFDKAFNQECFTTNDFNDSIQAEISEYTPIDGFVVWKWIVAA